MNERGDIKGEVAKICGRQPVVRGGQALRCAIIKAFDWPKRNEIFYYGIGQVFPGIIPPAAPAATGVGKGTRPVGISVAARSQWIG